MESLENNLSHSPEQDQVAPVQEPPQEVVGADDIQVEEVFSTTIPEVPLSQTGVPGESPVITLVSNRPAGILEEITLGTPGEDEKPENKQWLGGEKDEEEEWPKAA